MRTLQGLLRPELSVQLPSRGAVMARETPVCQAGPTWIKNRLKNRNALSPLTGQDWPALQAFFHLVALYGNSDERGRRCALAAMSWSLAAMQPSTRHLAKAGIPHVLDWSHEEEIWRQVSTLLSVVLDEAR
jgi:hypothetical protein